jgi:hypothetical protein
MNLAEKPHQDADSAISSVHRRSPIFRICKPFLSKFITASSQARDADYGVVGGKDDGVIVRQGPFLL